MPYSQSDIDEFELIFDDFRRAVFGARERVGEGLKITRTQVEIVKLISDKPRTTGELARLMFLTQSAVTQTVETLVRRGLVERQTDQSDRRIILLTLTAAGRELGARLRSDRQDYLAQLFEAIGPQDSRMLVRVVETMTRLLAQHESKPTQFSKGPKHGND